MQYGSYVFRVVFTVILPSIKSNTHPTPYEYTEYDTKRELVLRLYNLHNSYPKTSAMHQRFAIATPQQNAPLC